MYDNTSLGVGVEGKGKQSSNQPAITHFESETVLITLLSPHQWLIGRQYEWRGRSETEGNWRNLLTWLLGQRSREWVRNCLSKNNNKRRDIAEEEEESHCFGGWCGWWLVDPRINMGFYYDDGQTWWFIQEAAEERAQHQNIVILLRLRPGKWLLPGLRTG